MPRNVLPRLAAAALLCAALAACGATPEDEYVERPAEQFYNAAMDALQAGDYEKAVAQFNELERQHPYSSWSTRAQLMAAYARYLANDYEEAVIAVDRFVRLHPGNRNVAYAHYLKALSYYERISDVARDQRMTENALRSLEEISRRHPDSRYARDAKLKAALARDHLAGKEMAVGRYYLRRGHHLAAINRFRRVVDAYQTTSHVPEALHRLVEAYTMLGIDDEARKAAAVLGHNYPGSEWYGDSHALATGAPPRRGGEDRSLLRRLLDWLF